MRKLLNFLWITISYVMFIANIWLLAAPFVASRVIDAAVLYGGGFWTDAYTGYLNSTVLDLTPQFYVIMGGLLLINLNVMLATRFRSLRNIANYVNVTFGAVVTFIGLTIFGVGTYFGLPLAQIVVAFSLMTLGWVYLDIAVRHLRGEKVSVAFRVAPEEATTVIEDVPVVETPADEAVASTEEAPVTATA